MPKDIKKLGKASIVTTFALAVFAPISAHYAAASWMVPTLLVVIVSILLGNLMLLWEYRGDLPDIALLQRSSEAALDERVKPLTDSVGQLAPRLDQLESEVRILLQDAQGITRTRLSLSRRGTAVHRMGSRTLDDMLRLFDVTKQGYMVHGEHLSMLAYVQFWREMLHVQREINKGTANPETGDDATRLIARATHSNEIELWMPEHNQAAQELLGLQKQFVDAGGRIVRLLLSNSQTPAENCERVRAKMVSFRIEARHLYYPHPLEYDFIWVSNPNIDVVLTWHSGANGRGLSRCEVVDGVESHIERMWESVGTASEDVDGTFETVPPSRHRVNL